MRVATFNILHGRSLDDGSVDVERFAAAVRTIDADVLALQEVDRDQPRSLGSDLAAIAAGAMGARVHRFAAALAGTPDLPWQAATGEEEPGIAVYGVALLSRHPVSDWSVIRLPTLRGRVPMWHRPGKPTLSHDEARVAVVGTVEAPCGRLVAASTHLSFVRGWNARQLRYLAQAMAPADAPVLLMGDLNMGARQAASASGLRPLQAGPTFPADRPRRQLDHILARGVEFAGSGRLLRLPLSDHLAVVADVASSS